MEQIEHSTEDKTFKLNESFIRLRTEIQKVNRDFI